MENNTASFDTAQMLKAAGFPQDYENKHCLHWWESGYSGSKFVATDSEIESYRSKRYADETHDFVKLCAAPTAQEIADQLPGIVTISRYAGRIWEAEFKRSYVKGDTIAEAFALLWLQLDEVKS